MSRDERIRSLERSAAHDPAAADALVAERIRVTGRDPRRDPRPGDVVEAPPGRTAARTVREVVEVEPGVVSACRWVTYRHERRAASGIVERSRPLSTWRMWAARGRVVRVAP